MTRIISLLITLFILSSCSEASFNNQPEQIVSQDNRTVKIYTEQPSDFKPKIEVAACYSRFKDKYLLLQRSSTNKDLPDIWGVPGGKVHRNETKEEANIREFFEETGVKLQPEKIKYFKTIYIVDSQKSFIFHMFTYEFPEEPTIKLNPREHQNYAWKTSSEAIQLPLIPGEEECFKLLHP